ncbi:MAG: AI-2E family transporter [Rhodobacteraceae bacterium]|nr:AI-2E family transporter [Paracoccaceae bacterium]
MALPIHSQMKYWGIAAAVLLLMLWFLGDVMVPFVVGGAIAYFLDPVADRLQRWGFSRIAATVTISLAGLVVAVLLMLSIIPTLINQLTALVNSAPEIARKFETLMVARFPDLQDSTSTIRQALASIGKTIQSRGGEMVNGVITSAINVVSAVLFLLVVPVVTFYMLLDWDRMVAVIDRLLPRDHAPVIRRLGREIDATLAGFVRGQVMVCIILGIFYAVALMAAGLQFGGIVGTIAGAITFIPYVGAMVGGALAIGLALYQFWGDWLHVLLIAAIFAIGQFAEGNIITPRLVGKSVGLHPVWLLFALAAFGSLFGFIGMLVAVPVTAVMGVLVRFGVEQYRHSLLYWGSSGRTAALPEGGAEAATGGASARAADEPAP